MIRFFSGLLALLFVSLATPSFAQPGNTPPQDLRPTLRNMTLQEKIKLLEYMRYLGVSIDKEVQQSYEQLNAEKKERVQMYIQLKTQDAGAPLPRTTVRWNRDTIHFGTIEEGSILIDSFKVTNTGKQPYIIKEVKTSCDCTVLKFPEYPVMPGETATIRIEFDSRGKSGATEPGIIVYDNSSPNSRTILYFKGIVQQRKVPGKANQRN